MKVYVSILLLLSILNIEAIADAPATSFSLPKKYAESWWRSTLSLHDWKYNLIFHGGGNCDLAINREAPHGAVLQARAKAQYRGNEITLVTSDYNYDDDKGIKHIWKKVDKWKFLVLTKTRKGPPQVKLGSLILIKTPKGPAHVPMIHVAMDAIHGIVSQPFYE